MLEEVLEGIRVTAESGRFLCNQVNSLLQNYEKHSMVFTRRELEVLRCVKERLTSTEIAYKICRSFDTVRVCETEHT